MPKFEVLTLKYFIPTFLTKQKNNSEKLERKIKRFCLYWDSDIHFWKIDNVFQSPSF